MDNPAVHNLDDVRLRAENGQIVLEVAGQTVPVDVDIDGGLSLDEIEAFTDNSIDAKGSDLENLGSVSTEQARIGEHVFQTGNHSPTESIADTTSSTYEEICLMGGAATGPPTIPEDATFYGRFIVQHSGVASGDEQFIRPTILGSESGRVELDELELNRDGEDGSSGIGITDTGWVELTSLDSNDRELRGLTLEGKVDGDSASWADARTGLLFGWRADDE